MLCARCPSFARILTAGQLGGFLFSRLSTGGVPLRTLSLRLSLGSCRIHPRARRDLALDLRAMHYAACRVVERVTPVHRGTVVPQ
jgi:hypothetical protein